MFAKCSAENCKCLAVNGLIYYPFLKVEIKACFKMLSLGGVVGIIYLKKSLISKASIIDLEIIYYIYFIR